jgi:hypothetical protein
MLGSDAGRPWNNGSDWLLAHRLTQVSGASTDKKCKGGNKMVAIILATIWIGGWALIIHENIRIDARVDGNVGPFNCN